MKTSMLTPHVLAIATIFLACAPAPAAAPAPARVPTPAPAPAKVVRAPAGARYGIEEKGSPWVAEAVSVGHATFGIVAITSFPPDGDPLRASLDRYIDELSKTDGLVLDLRGNEAPSAPTRALPFDAGDRPMAVLVDAACAAGCESIVHDLARRPKARIFERAGAFDEAMAWMVWQTDQARVVPTSEFVLPEAARTAEASRLEALGLDVSKGGPVLEKPWASPLTRRSFVVPQRWLGRKTARVVYAPALAADLDALELVMSRAYGGWDIAKKRGFDWAAWFGRWRRELAAAGARWLPTKEAFAPVDAFERFQLDNHTTIPLGVRFGSGSQTLLLRGAPAGACSALRGGDGREIPLDASDAAQAPRRAKRFDGERIADAWYIAVPRRHGDIAAISCGGRWTEVTPPAQPDPAATASTILELSGQPKDRPSLRHLGDKLAYLRLPSFHKANTEIIVREQSGWEKRTGKERAIIVDLRGNEGGDAAFRALDGWVSKEDIRASIGFDKRGGASCLYPALRWGYSAISSTGLTAPLSPPMRSMLQGGLDPLFAEDDPACAPKFVEERANAPLRARTGAPHRRGKSPIILALVDQGCGSDCELMTATLAKIPEVAVVGVNTFGVVQYIQPGYSVLPNTRLPFRIALGTSDTYADHRSLDGYGIDVDVILDGANAWKRDGLVRLAQLLGGV